MKSTKIIYWATTTLIFLFEGLMPALTSQTEMAKEGLNHLGYPGFVFDFIFAAISHWAVDGFGMDAVFPLIIMAVLLVSYRSYHQLQSTEN
jgi:hypothetical protein